MDILSFIDQFHASTFLLLENEFQCLEPNMIVILIQEFRYFEISKIK